MDKDIKDIISQALKLVFWIVFLVFLYIIFLKTNFLYFFNNFNNVLRLLESIAWPIVVLIAFFFFRKIFTYLFLSIEEFNLFGTRGKLKNVYELIQERAQALFEEEQERKEIEEEQKRYEEELSELRSSRDRTVEGFERAVKLSRELLDENKELRKKIVLEAKSEREKAINETIRYFAQKYWVKKKQEQELRYPSE